TWSVTHARGQRARPRRCPAACRRQDSPIFPGPYFQTRLDGNSDTSDAPHLENLDFHENRVFTGENGRFTRTLTPSRTHLDPVCTDLDPDAHAPWACLHKP